MMMSLKTNSENQFQPRTAKHYASSHCNNHVFPYDDDDGYLTKHELRGLLVGLEMVDRESTTTDGVNKVMDEFDFSRDRQDQPR